MENEILTPAELLKIWDICINASYSCAGCTNAVPGSENIFGIHKCKKNLYQATMETLAAVIEAEKQEKRRKTAWKTEF